MTDLRQLRGGQVNEETHKRAFAFWLRFSIQQILSNASFN